MGEVRSAGGSASAPWPVRAPCAMAPVGGIAVAGIAVLLLRGWRWQGRTAFPTSGEQKLSGCETLATTRSRIALCHACSGVSAAEQKSGRSAAKVTFVAQGVP